MPLNRVPEGGKEGYRELTPISGDIFEVAYADNPSEAGTDINRAYLLKNESRNVVYSSDYDAAIAVGDVVSWGSTEWEIDWTGKGVVEELFTDGGTDYIAIVLNGAITLSGLAAGSIYYAQSDGSIAVTETPYYIGKAISTTVLIVSPVVPDKVNKNYIINGNPVVNQREYVSGATLAAGVYGPDRYKAGASGGDNTVATVLNVTTRTILAGKSLIQIVLGTSLLSGSYTLSWTGTAQCKIDGGSFANSPITATLIGGTDATIEIGEGTFTKLKLEEGIIVTPDIPKTFAEELIDCQRYYWQGKLNGNGDAFFYGAAGGTTMIAGERSFGAKMRATPSDGIITTPTYSNCSNADIISVQDGLIVKVTITATGKYRASGGVYFADAEL